MRKPLFILFYAFSLGVMLTGCKNCPKEPDPNDVDAIWKKVVDADGNRYESDVVKLDTNNDGIVGGTEDYNQEMLKENLRVSKPANGESTKNSSGQVVTACYKNISSNCDTLGALYSVDKVFNQSISEQITSIASKGDADGDGYEDEAVRQALIAAGYDPNIYTIVPEFDPDNGITGVIAGQGMIAPGAVLNAEGKYVNPDGKIIDPAATLTYTVSTNGDTTYTPGAGGKILVPDLSKIDVSKIPVVKGPKGICPDGYHIPTDGEWKQLELALGMSKLDVNRESQEIDRGANKNLGEKLAHYLKLKYAGYMSSNGTFAQLGEVDAFWTSTGGKDKYNREYMWVRYIDTIQHKGIIRKKIFTEDRSLFSVRCFKD